ncbi:hypothetical protein IDM48_09990 [Rothia amarae]|uniref:Uncharacterized protein n=1 Tax=Rothia amarae TaxID=169480 RepID=A0A7H2BJ28_9MICC|nr:hypothetical protein [Rothia amarae]QNV39674.1 hypothetical protein IDM48_09990 [Rothia amarae]
MSISQHQNAFGVLNRRNALQLTGAGELYWVQRRLPVEQQQRRLLSPFLQHWLTNFLLSSNSLLHTVVPVT